MATFEDSEKVRINKQYQEIVRKIPFSAPFDLRRAVEVAEGNFINRIAIVWTTKGVDNKFGTRSAL